MNDMIDNETIDKLNKITSEPEASLENTIDSGDKKIDGAIAAVSKRAGLDKAVEGNLSTGLDNPEFAAANKKIDKKRKVYTSGFKNTLTLKKTNADFKSSLKLKKIGPDFKSTLKLKNSPTVEENVLDDYKQSMKDLEEEMSDSFNKFVYSKLVEMNRVILLDHLVDNNLSEEKSEVINIGFASDGNYNVVAFSDNGYLMQLTNKEEVKTEDGFDVKNEKAEYNLIAPDGTVLFEKKNYDITLNTLKSFANGYHKTLKEEFNQTENNKPSLEESPEQNNDTPEAENHDLEPVVEKSDSTIEYESSPLFNRYVLNNLGGITRDRLTEVLLEKGTVNRSDVESFIFNRTIAPSNIVSFSNVGYMTQLINIEDVRGENSIDIRSDSARYNLINPSGEVIKQNLSWQDTVDLIRSESETYLEKLNQEFEANKEEIGKELADNDLTENNSETSELEPEFNSPFNENISRYAENIGIKPEELAANKEFLALSPEQQQFALENLRRSSLAKAKVEGHQSFMEEKASKKWWQVGFGLNQNYHKERHKIEAVQNIESRGLEGYGETELAWLVEVIKTGPEVRINDAGEVMVNCLQESSFSEEQKELVAKYNEAAREYIETPNNKVSKDLREELNAIKFELLKSTDDVERMAEINNLLLKSKNNIDLLKFLSADKETEQLLDKMAVTSLKGKDKARAMFGAHKDKLGYMAMGFTLRTGTKFALANSACLANAVSYGVGPMVAFIVGGFRGHNMGKKELIEKGDLAKLGIKDQSDTAKAMNLATGKKEGVNFGLTDKLQNLINKIHFNNINSEPREEEANALRGELNIRIEYTENKINSESIDYGSIDERNINYLNLINTLAEAKSIVGSGIVFGKVKKYWNSGGAEKLTRGDSIDLEKLGLNKNENETDETYKERLSQNKKFVEYQAWANNEKRIDELSKIDVHDRLASFLNYREEKQNKKELKFLVKKTVTGAVMGATFAAAGAFAAEKLGISDWMSDHLNKGVFGKIGDGIESFRRSVGGSIKHIFSHEAVASTSSTNSGAHIAEVAVATKTVNPIDTSTVKVSSSAATEQAVATKSVVPKVAKFVDEISNKGLGGKSDSVWRSTREIFKNNAEELGYKGDLNDQSAINHWAETQTANTIHNSGEISDKIYEGNKVSLVKDGEHFKAVVEQAQGAKPGQLNHEVKVSTNHEPIKSTEPVANETNNQFADDTRFGGERELEVSNNEPEVYNLPDDSTQTNTPIIHESTEAVNNTQYGKLASIEDIAKEDLHVKPESLSKVGDDLVYKGAGKSTIIFSKGAIMTEIVDVSGKKIPTQFADELIHGKRLASFTRGGGLDKIFAAWSKLGANDKLIYESMDWFKKGTFDSPGLIKQIQGVYQANMDTISIEKVNGISHFISGDGQKFDMTLKGIKKMIAFLPRK